MRLAFLVCFRPVQCVLLSFAHSHVQQVPSCNPTEPSQLTERTCVAICTIHNARHPYDSLSEYVWIRFRVFRSLPLARVFEKCSHIVWKAIQFYRMYPYGNTHHSQYPVILRSVGFSLLSAPSTRPLIRTRSPFCSIDHSAIWNTSGLIHLLPAPLER